MENGNRNLKIENSDIKNPIKSFQDLIVYKNLYRAMILVHKEVASKLPKEEKFDLVDQMKRASKSAPALIAEGFARRYQRRHWQKYINDTIGESNEMIHHLSTCIDIYYKHIDASRCREIIDIYDTSCKQLTKLGQSWQNFHSRRES